MINSILFVLLFTFFNSKNCSACLALRVMLVSLRPTCYGIGSQGPTTATSTTRRPSPASPDCCWSPHPPAPRACRGSSRRVCGSRATLCGRQDAASPPSGYLLGAPSRPLPRLPFTNAQQLQQQQKLQLRQKK